jgi:hypothetical protein
MKAGPWTPGCSWANAGPGCGHPSPALAPTFSIPPSSSPAAPHRYLLNPDSDFCPHSSLDSSRRVPEQGPQASKMTNSDLPPETGWPLEALHAHNLVSAGQLLRPPGSRAQPSPANQGKVGRLCPSALACWCFRTT